MSKNTMTEGTVRLFELDAVRMWNNARTSFDQGALRELADSLRDSGGALHYPVGWLAEAGAEPGTEVLLLLGERRLRAYRMLRDEGVEGFARIPVRVIGRPSEAEARKWSLVENVQREELRPSEAGAWLAGMMEMTGDSGRPVWTLDSLAEEIGKSRSWVVQAMALTRAPEGVRAAVDGGFCSLEVGAMVGSLPAEAREGAASEMVLGAMGAMTRDQARDWMGRNYRRDLRRAVFSPEEEGLDGRRACVRCEWWGGNREDVGGKHAGSVCLSPGCFEAKQLAALRGSGAGDGGGEVLESRAELWEGHSGRLAPDSGYVDLGERPPLQWLDCGEGVVVPVWRELLEGCGVRVWRTLDGLGEVRELAEVGEALRAAGGSRWAGLFRPAALSGYLSPEERAAARAVASAGDREEGAALAEVLGSLYAGWWEAAGADARGFLGVCLESLMGAALKREDVGLVGAATGVAVSSPGELVESLGPDVEPALGALALALSVRRVRYEGLGVLAPGGALEGLGALSGCRVRELVGKVRRRREAAEAEARELAEREARERASGELAAARRR